ncbi:MAG: cytidylate kinase-like family protein [Deltaproteobacteria bacterium HGW-Deltaproteobacteria-19]|jgi:cytidylate kinase|nr:MAG: cytidylate kinase-like family protein [Deltaproteobacteria bacterium HGW-Deltaproteobacteria-19]
MGTYPDETLDKIIEKQIKRWQVDQKKKYKKPIRPVITISRLPGANASKIAKQLSKDLKIDAFDQEIIEEIAKNTKASKKVIASLDEQDISIVKEWLAFLSSERQVWPYEYIEQLIRVISAIGAHGHAVILGRGASYILPKEVCLRVLVVAPMEKRIQNVVDAYSVSADEAKRNVMRTESDRRAFIRRYFHADMMDPMNYDLVINTENCSVPVATGIITEAFNNRNWYNFSIDKMKR